VVTGARGGVVNIDGVVHADWFGKIFELTLGKHILEVVPPNSDCCINLGPKSFEVKAGEGVQPVAGAAPFKDATLALSGEGSEAQCPMLFNGKLLGGGSIRIKIPGPESKVKGQCTIVGPPAGSAPKVEPVELGAGESRRIVWQGG